MSRSPIVIKVGGALLDDAPAMARLFTSVKEVQTERPVVIVHGGGPLVETLMASLGLKSSKIDGLRVTPDEHMPYIVAKDLLRVWNPRKITAILLNNCKDLERSCTIKRPSYFHF